MTIDWVMDGDVICERSSEWALAPSFGEVAGARRFRLTHVGSGVWEAVDLLAPEAAFNAITRGSHLTCVEWCWSRLKAPVEYVRTGVMFPAGPMTETA